MKKIIVAIDGYSSTGKSTLAKRLAKEFSYIFFDTGALYRALSYFALKKKIFFKNTWESEKFLAYLPKISIELKLNQNNEVNFLLNGKRLRDGNLRTLEVSNKVSLIAALPQVRKYLLDLQRNFGKQKGLVIDGRDIGSVVFPKAELKFFFSASLEIRAKRRYEEFSFNGQKITYEQVLKNINQRDQIDSKRQTAPLLKASDAIEIDTTYLNLEEAFFKIYELTKEKINACNK